jgi:hypothetical protein
MRCDKCGERKAYKYFRKLKRFLMFYREGIDKNWCGDCQKSFLGQMYVPPVDRDPFLIVFD